MDVSITIGVGEEMVVYLCVQGAPVFEGWIVSRIGAICGF